MPDLTKELEALGLGKGKGKGDIALERLLVPPTSPRRKATTASRPPRATGTAASPSMSSQRNRPPRGSVRGGTHETGEEAQLWAEIREQVQKLEKNEARAKDLNAQIFEMESSHKAKLEAGNKLSIEEIDALDTLYREEVRVTDNTKELLDTLGTQDKVSILQGLVKHTEESQEVTAARASNSREARSAMDFDGPSDSPIPSPAENKPIRKFGTARTGSQPPKAKDSISNQDKTEASETNPNRTKITFALGAEVAFRPKPTKPGEETDWIQGIVVKIIGEGKSRRYEVQDPFPDEVKGTPGQTHKSSASSMVQIPPVGAALPDYEIGKRVLALYPETSTFYRADVKAILEGGAKVQLLFEDETAGAFKVVERRFVLDHKG